MRWGRSEPSDPPGIAASPGQEQRTRHRPQQVKGARGPEVLALFPNKLPAFTSVNKQRAGAWHSPAAGLLLPGFFFFCRARGRLGASRGRAPGFVGAALGQVLGTERWGNSTAEPSPREAR